MVIRAEVVVLRVKGGKKEVAIMVNPYTPCGPDNVLPV